MGEKKRNPVGRKTWGRRWERGVVEAKDARENAAQEAHGRSWGCLPRSQGTDAHTRLHQGYLIPTQPSCHRSCGAVVREGHVGSGRDRCHSAAGRARTSSGRLPPKARSPSPTPCTVPPPLPGCFQGWRLCGLWMCSTSKELLTEPIASTQCLSATLTGNPNQFTPSLHDP